MPDEAGAYRADDADARLRQECMVFAGYLGERALDRTVLDHYVAFHASMPMNDVLRIDLRLVAVAARGAFLTALADAYCRRARPYGLLRRKLVLVVAILESTPSTHSHFDTPLVGGRIATVASLAWIGVSAVVRVAIALPVFGVLHLFSRAPVGARHHG